MDYLTLDDVFIDLSNPDEVVELLNRVKDSLDEYISNNLSVTRSEELENYLSTNFNIKTPIRKIFKIAVDNLKTVTNYSKLTFRIDKFIMVDDIRLNSIIKLITYGNLEIKPYNIWTESFEYIKNNMDEIIFGLEEDE